MEQQAFSVVRCKQQKRGCTSRVPPLDGRGGAPYERGAGGESDPISPLVWRGGSTGWTNPWRSTPTSQVTRPIVHQPSPAIEQVRPPVGCFDLVADLVRQRRLRHLARMIGLLNRPEPEAGAEPVQHRCNAKLAQQEAQLAVIEWLPVPAGEHQRTGFLAQGPVPLRESPGRGRTAKRGVGGSSLSAWPAQSTPPRPDPFPPLGSSRCRQMGRHPSDGGAV